MKLALFLSASVLGGVAALAACSSSSGSNNAGSTDAGAEAGDASSGDDGGSAPDSGQGDDGGAQPNGLAWTSGMRLRAIVDIAGSARLFVGWHDKQLDVDCTYGLASDAMNRCLPINGLSVYDDAACTNPAAAVGNALVGKVKYVPDPFSPFVCGHAPDFYALGATYVPAAVYTKGTDGTCNAGTVDPNVTYSHLGAKVEPSAFIAESDFIDPRGTKIAAIQWVGPDMSRQDGTLIDLNRNNGDPCRQLSNKAGNYFCAPSRLAYLENFFTDTGCSTRAALYHTDDPTTCALPPAAILDSTGGAPDLTLFEPGAKVAMPVHQGSPASCQLFTNPGSLPTAFYVPGASLPLSTLPPLTVKDQGMGRMLQHTLVTDKGSLGAILDFYDSTKNAVCRQATGTDAVARCMPIPDAAVYTDLNLFLDAGCTQPTFQRYVTNPAPSMGGFAHVQTQTPNQVAIVTLGAKLATPANVWTLSGVSCNPGTVDGSTEYYGTTVVPPTDFVAITRGVE